MIEPLELRTRNPEEGLFDWHTDAACRDYDPELWFSKNDTKEASHAKRVCASCSVQEPCAAENDRFEAGRGPAELFGIVAGKTAQERISRRSGKPIPVPNRVNGRFSMRLALEDVIGGDA